MTSPSSTPPLWSPPPNPSSLPTSPYSKHCRCSASRLEDIDAPLSRRNCKPPSLLHPRSPHPNDLDPHTQGRRGTKAPASVACGSRGFLRVRLGGACQGLRRRERSVLGQPLRLRASHLRPVSSAFMRDLSVSASASGHTACIASAVGRAIFSTSSRHHQRTTTLTWRCTCACSPLLLERAPSSSVNPVVVSPHHATQDALKMRPS
jgi:hypothetical protein